MTRPLALTLCLALLLLGCTRSVSPAPSQLPTPVPTPSAAPVVQPSQAVSSSQSNLPDESDWRLILVNGEHPLPEDFSVALGKSFDGYELDQRILSDWEEMYRAAAADGVPLLLCYGHRTLEQAAGLFEKQIGRQMAQYGYTREQAAEAAKRFVAPPGYSEHHTGLALDIITPSYQVLNEGYADTAAAIWLRDNAHRFGFILRYPKDKQEITGVVFEPWHYRFVGKEAAEAIHAQGLCLEEYLGKN